MDMTNEELADLLEGAANVFTDVAASPIREAAARLRQQSEYSARYQWLRKKIRFGNLVIATVSDLEGLKSWSGDDPDSAIDKARSND